MPLPYWAFILIGILLGLLLAVCGYLPYLYWDETAEYNWQRLALPHLVNYFFLGILAPIVYCFSQKYPLHLLGIEKITMETVHYLLGSFAPSILSRLIECWLLFFHFYGS